MQRILILARKICGPGDHESGLRTSSRFVVLYSNMESTGVRSYDTRSPLKKIPARGRSIFFKKISARKQIRQIDNTILKFPMAH